MAIAMEVIEKQRSHLKSLLTIKKANEGIVVKSLHEEIVTAVAPMMQEDIAWVEKVVGVKAMDNL